MLLLPNAFRLYLQRNPKLEKFRVKFVKDDYDPFYHNHEIMADFDRKPVYQDSAAFLPALSRAKFLTEIKIDGVKFFDKELLLKISEILPSFPSLQRLTLRLKVFSYHSRSTEAPSLNILETLSTSCPHLKWFNVPLTWNEAPVIPQRPSSHRLPRMFIAGGKNFQTVTFQEKIAVARYLMTLFPHLQALSRSTEKPLDISDSLWPYRVAVTSIWSAMDRASDEHECEGREKSFWNEIEGLVRSYQDTRRQAIAEVSRALPYHDA
jgi:hypothetical protein